MFGSPIQKKLLECPDLTKKFCAKYWLTSQNWLGYVIILTNNCLQSFPKTAPNLISFPCSNFYFLAKSYTKNLLNSSMEKIAPDANPRSCFCCLSVTAIFKSFFLDKFHVFFIYGDKRWNSLYRLKNGYSSVFVLLIVPA